MSFKHILRENSDYHQFHMLNFDRLEFMSEKGKAEWRRHMILHSADDSTLVKTFDLWLKHLISRWFNIYIGLKCKPLPHSISVQTTKTAFQFFAFSFLIVTNHSNTLTQHHIWIVILMQRTMKPEGSYTENQHVVLSDCAQEPTFLCLRGGKQNTWLSYALMRLLDMVSSLCTAELCILK